MLDQYQHEAVYTKNYNSIVIAAPGSGKTTVIINRVAHLIKSKTAQPSQIAVITFTRTAAVNMKNRFKNICDREPPFFGTFHSLFYRIIREQNKEIKLISEKESLNIIFCNLRRYNERVSIEKALQVLGSFSLYRFSVKEGKEFIPPIDSDIFFECLKSYDDYKRSNELMDFDDLQLICLELLQNNISILKRYQSRFKFLLVDEFQDCDLLQLKFLKLLNPKSSIFAVGDEDQCIYSFRGSRPDFMVNFQEHFQNAKKYYLCINYRSMQNIVEVSKELIQNNRARNNKKIIAFKSCEKYPAQNNINLRTFENNNIQASIIIDKILNEVRSKKYGYNDCAILYRTHLENRGLVDACIRKEIPFVIYGEQFNFYEHMICKDLIAYLRLIQDKSDRNSFIRIINKPSRYIGRLCIKKVTEHPHIENCFDIIMEQDKLQYYIIRNIKLLEYKIDKLNRLIKKDKLNLKEIVNYIMNKIGYANYLKTYSESNNVNINENIEIVEEFKNVCGNFESISELISHIEKVKDVTENQEKKDNENSLILSTIHGVKGMEFKNVFIIDCCEGYIPHKNSIEKNLEEERRLFYVAITRAIEELHICVPEKINCKSSEASRFIKECSIST